VPTAGVENLREQNDDRKFRQREGRYARDKRNDGEENSLADVLCVECFDMAAAAI